MLRMDLPITGFTTSINQDKDELVIVGGLSGLDSTLFYPKGLSYEIKDESIKWIDFNGNELIDSDIKPWLRAFHSATKLENELVIIGGFVGELGNFEAQRIYTIDLDTMEWKIKKYSGLMGHRLQQPQNSPCHDSSIDSYINDSENPDLMDVNIYMSIGGDYERHSETTIAENDDFDESGYENLVDITKRMGHTVIQFNQHLFLFGGFTNEGDYSNQIFKITLNDYSFEYEELTNSIYTPVGRFFHTANLWDGTILIYGGHDGHSCLNDLWQFNLKTNQWQLINNNSPKPCARYQHISFIREDKLYVVGGRDSLGRRLNDMWIWDCTGNEGWTLATNQFLTTSDGVCDGHLINLDNGQSLVVGGLIGDNGLPEFTISILEDITYVKRNTNDFQNTKMSNIEENQEVGFADFYMEGTIHGTKLNLNEESQLSNGKIIVNHNAKPSYQFDNQSVFSPINGVHFSQDNSIQPINDLKIALSPIKLTFDSSRADNIKLDSGDKFAKNSKSSIKISDSEILESRSFGPNDKCYKEVESLEQHIHHQSTPKLQYAIDDYLNERLKQLPLMIEKDLNTVIDLYELVLNDLIFLKTRFLLIARNHPLQEHLELLDQRIERLEVCLLETKAKSYHSEQQCNYYKKLSESLGQEIIFLESKLKSLNNGDLQEEFGLKKLRISSLESKTMNLEAKVKSLQTIVEEQEKTIQTQNDLLKGYTTIENKIDHNLKCLQELDHKLSSFQAIKNETQLARLNNEIMGFKHMAMDDIYSFKIELDKNSTLLNQVLETMPYPNSKLEHPSGPSEIVNQSIPNPILIQDDPIKGDDIHPSLNNIIETQYLHYVIKSQASLLSSLKRRNKILTSNLASLTNHQFTEVGFKEMVRDFDIINNPIAKFLTEDEIFGRFKLQLNSLSKDNLSKGRMALSNLKGKVPEAKGDFIESLGLATRLRNLYTT